MIGSIEYGESNRLNRCESRRQISSTFKPFLYAQAFEDGICTPGHDLHRQAREDGEQRRHAVGA